MISHAGGGGGGGGGWRRKECHMNTFLAVWDAACIAIGTMLFHSSCTKLE